MTHRARRAWAWRAVLMRLVLALAALGCSGSALAHAALLSSVPAEHAVLSELPSQATLAFDEPVAPLVFRLVGPDGSTRELDKTQVRTVSNGVVVVLPELAGHGAYALSWRVISADGHPVGGNVLFSVGEATAGSVPGVTTHPDRAGAIWLGRWLWYLALFLGIGLAVAGVAAPSPRAQRTVSLWLLAGGALLTALNLGLLGVDALDLPLSGLLEVRAWQTAAATTFGWSALAALLALASAALAGVRPTARVGRMSALAALALLGAALASSGHASTAPPAWLARPAVWLHAVAVTLWIGMLLPLVLALRHAADLQLLRRFSRWIPLVLLALVGSGVALTALQIDGPSALVHTAYGRVLLAKLVLVALLLGLGAYNRYQLTEAVMAGDEGACAVLRRVIRWEVLVAVAVLAVVALWRQTPPPRAVHAAPAAVVTPVSMHAHGDEAMAMLDFTPAHGDTAATMMVDLMAPDGSRLTAKEVNVVFFSRARGIEPIEFPAKPAADGVWRVSGIRLPKLDQWDVRVEVLVSDFQRVTLETTLALVASLRSSADR